MGNILEAIWNLPWYKVAVIAVADDAILFLKLWWLWCIFLAVFAIVVINGMRKDKKRG